MPSSILTCTNTIQLSEFVAHLVPKIWTGTPFMTTDRLNLFRTFCQNIIKATQISSSCILVALFYIYRLRFAYPSIRGSMGSEVRLFTTALILANKFLDDNTFTNKTWSEVSSVPLHELNIMEMEFLSALQYRTCVHHVQFFSWTSQCQHWMSQLTARALFISTPPSRRMNKRSADHFMVDKTSKKAYYSHSVLSWSSSSYHPSAASAASAVATVAAATAMNVNYSNFIPRV
ncbi:cyclin-domain-containing protein [Mucor mucedo]|uniref:cyclin-domain-containing protein n=1 Tax=Mucor mucedo TaxID=29922 RepID=UPI00221F87C0|nr:cyclin-domain-containing protein [Mucor mucedo]KAI7896547.1 cyclin-domain-containing protein [Mucor mucedo]